MSNPGVWEKTKLTFDGYKWSDMHKVACLYCLNCIQIQCCRLYCHEHVFLEQFTNSAIHFQHVPPDIVGPLLKTSAYSNTSAALRFGL